MTCSSRGRFAVAVTLLVCANGAASTFAAGPAAVDPKEAAREHVARAKASYDLGHFDEAIREYEAAYRLMPDPVLLFNVGQSYRLEGQPEQARAAYRGYLRNAPSTEPNRDLAQRRLAEVDAQLEAQRSRGATHPPPVQHGAGLPGASPLSTPQTTLFQSPPVASRSESAPLYKRRWFWGTVGAAVTTGIVTAVLLSRSAGPNSDCVGISPCGTVP